MRKESENNGTMKTAEYGGYTFRKASEAEEEKFSGGMICNIYDLLQYDDFPKAYGQLVSLFGEAKYVSENLENQYEYFICATDKSGDDHVLCAYSGPTGPALSGYDTDEGLVQALLTLIREAVPADYDYEGDYMDGPCKVFMGVKDGKPYMREEELALSQEEFTELYKKLYGLS